MSPQRAWCLYDWAGQPFFTLVLTFVFAPYFAASVASDPVTGQAIWSNTITVAGLSMAILAPILGAIADHAGPRKPWIAVFSALFVLGAVGLWGAVPDMASPLPILVLFGIAYFGAEIAFVFYSAMLPSLASKAEIGHLSGRGYAWGYVAGILSLVLVLGFLAPAPGGEKTLLGLSPAFGLDPSQGEPQRATGPLAALWFVLFAVPLFLVVPDAPRRANPGSAVRSGLAALTASIKSLPGERSLFAFLIGSMLYRDALAGVYIFGGIYAAGVLGWGTFQLGVFGIIAAL
ncbi:MAG: MFS transporter, partial [Pseudomonadota bacterium]